MRRALWWQLSTSVNADNIGARAWADICIYLPRVDPGKQRGYKYNENHFTTTRLDHEVIFGQIKALVQISG